MKRNVKNLAVILSWVALTSGAMAQIEGSSWQDGSGQSIRFAQGGRVFIKASCNRFFGGYLLAGKSLKFGPLASTRMACPAPVMARERRFISKLQAARRFRVKNNRLQLFARSNRLLVTLASARSG